MRRQKVPFTRPGSRTPLPPHPQSPEPWPKPARGAGRGNGSVPVGNTPKKSDRLEAEGLTRKEAAERQQRTVNATVDVNDLESVDDVLAALGFQRRAS